MKSQGSIRRSRWWMLCMAGALLWWILPVFAKNLLYRSVDLFHAPLQMMAGKVGEVQDYAALRLSTRNELIEQNRSLSRELAHLRLQAQRQHAIGNYVDRLERLLALSPATNHRPEYARIIRRDVHAWFEVVLLDKGSLHGVEPGMAVVYRDGLLGRVKEVGPLQSRVILLTSPGFRLTVNAGNDSRPIAYSGGGQRMWEPLQAQVQHVPQDVAGVGIPAASALYIGAWGRIA
jgi:cell shape-determining protein MreC